MFKPESELNIRLVIHWVSNIRIAAIGCVMEAGDNLVRGATSGAYSQLATKERAGFVCNKVVQESVKLSCALQPKPLAIPGNLSVASSTAHLLRLPM